MTNKERKNNILAEVTSDKMRQKARKLEIAAMSADAQAKANADDREKTRTAKAQRKLDIKQMSKDERKAAKKHDKIYKKLKNRPIRFAAWGVVAVFVLYIGFTFGPVLGDIGRLLDIKLVSDTPEAIAARENSEKIAGEISDEGIVLLKNDGNLLPIGGDRLNIFGFAAYNLRYGGGGSGGADQSRAVDLFQGLSNAGIEYNNTLRDVYLNHEASGGSKQSTGLMQIADMFLGNSNIDEPSIDYLSDSIINDAKAFSSNALIVIGSDGVEASDFKKDELRLTNNKRQLIERVANNFENVIIIINAGNAIELGFLNDYPSIKAALWVGTPGPQGFNSLGKILAGQTNPSGRLTDTYVYDVSSNPAGVNFGDYKYENVDMAFINYNEGIYIGYRFYETYYKNDEVGYSKAVQFPFGYGLSYTEFDWKVVESSTVIDDNNISIAVEVTNTGSMAGKDVVQVYFSPPYTEGGIEKSFIELGGYAKTQLLSPGESQVVTISFPTRDMSSYDMHNRQAYVLEKGQYEIKIGTDVHSIKETISYTVAEDVTYDTDEATGTAIVNQFPYADGGLKYLSRSDWSGTYPNNDNLSYVAPQEVVNNLNKAPDKVTGQIPVTGANNGIMLADMKGLAYDDPKWEAFLDQFTVKEMKELITRGAYKTTEISRLGVPQSILLDGPAGINFFFAETVAGSFPTEVVISSTWNDELAYRMGEAVGREANAYGVHGWYAPGMNIHRTPQGGRNFEYFSEDPLVSGKMASAMVKGAQSHDVLVFMKHFALNDQETNARSGITVWANEQAIREIYLRPFEITVKEGEVTAAMSSFVYMGYKWCGGNPELLKNVLRDEWGFVGFVSTDAVLGSFMDLNMAIRYGNDIMLDPVPTFNGRYFDKLYKDDPVGILEGARYCTHNICYSLLQTELFE